MEEVVKKATFSFKGYKVTKFFFEEPKEGADTFRLDFNPSGIFSQRTSTFYLKFDFKAFSQDEKQEYVKEVINVQVTADFQFGAEMTFMDVPPFFYKNSMAIVFPYLRAFISTMTFQANVKPLLLPIMNLSALEDILKQHTSVLE